MTVSKAAVDLGISRQAIYDIKAGKYCPSLALVQRACDVWELKFNFRGLQVSKGTIRPPTGERIKQPQAELFELVGKLETGKLEVIRAKRVGKAMEVVLRIQLTA